ncbi:MAG: hypothetical protein KKD56_02885 [Acidobacteria bacterium]|nr:hypothetical protein [Acidobacteriota bacterium]MBU1474883.1 hypothetical protein [Acidobacteriota bacterium]
MKNISAIAIFLIICCSLTLHAVVPEKWELYRFEDFLKGKFDGVSVSSDGRLILAPNEVAMDTPGEEFYLSLLFGKNDDLFIGTGHSGHIIHIDRTGKAELYYNLPEMDVFCLAQDSAGNLYAGTSPGGRIYKITEKDKGEPFFDPQERYIWDLLIADDGSLLAAVGEEGGIYRINMEGQGVSILKADENHILSLYQDRDGNLLAGSGGKGHLYRLTDKGRAEILFESPFEEVRSIVQDKAGNIYIAAGGMVQKAAADLSGGSIPSAGASSSDADVTVTVSAAALDSAAASSVTSSTLTGTGGQPGALYRIDGRGAAKMVWSSAEELIYTLAWDSQDDRIIFGTGKKGRIYSYNQSEQISLLLQKDAEQVYGLYPRRSRIYMLTNNPSGMSYLEDGQRFEGEYVSRVLDTTTPSLWGKMEWRAVNTKDTSLQFLTRSGNTVNPNKTWSEWSPPYQNRNGEQILSPKARYLQFKIVFRTQSGKDSPIVDKVCLFHRELNVEPTFLQLEALPPNVVLIKPPLTEDVIWGTDDKEGVASADSDSKTFLAPRRALRKGFQTIIWQAADKNGDNLVFTISVREDESSRWRVLKDDWTEEIFTFESQTLPDGIYFIKVEASDRMDNPAGTELKAEKMSRAIVVDNSLPEIQGFQAKKSGNSLNVTFTAQETFSYIREVKYLVRPGQWMMVFPEDGICDSDKETFKFSLTLPPNADDMITVRVTDAHGNVGVHRATF